MQSIIDSILHERMQVRQALPYTNPPEEATFSSTMVAVFPKDESFVPYGQRSLRVMVNEVEIGIFNNCEANTPTPVGEYRICQGPRRKGQS